MGRFKLVPSHIQTRHQLVLGSKTHSSPPKSSSVPCGKPEFRVPYISSTKGQIGGPLSPLNQTFQGLPYHPSINIRRPSLRSQNPAREPLPLDHCLAPPSGFTSPVEDANHPSYGPSSAVFITEQTARHTSHEANQESTQYMSCHTTQQVTLEATQQTPRHMTHEMTLQETLHSVITLIA